MSGVRSAIGASIKTTDERECQLITAVHAQVRRNRRLGCGTAASRLIILWKRRSKAV